MDLAPNILDSISNFGATYTQKSKVLITLEPGLFDLQLSNFLFIQA